MIHLPYIGILLTVLAGCVMVIVGAFIYETRTHKFVDSRWVSIPFALMVVSVVGFFLITVLSEIVK